MSDERPLSRFGLFALLHDPDKNPSQRGDIIWGQLEAARAALHAEREAACKLREALGDAEETMTNAINDYVPCRCPNTTPGDSDSHGDCSTRELLVSLFITRAALSSPGVAVTPEPVRTSQFACGDCAPDDDGMCSHTRTDGALPDADVWKWTCHRCGYFVESVVEAEMRTLRAEHLRELLAASPLPAEPRPTGPGVAAELRPAREPCVFGRVCSRHGFIHGAEAEQLREEFDKLTQRFEIKGDEIQRVLDKVDARDSIAWREDREAEEREDAIEADRTSRPSPGVAVTLDPGLTVKRLREIAEPVPCVIVGCDRYQANGTRVCYLHASLAASPLPAEPRPTVGDVDWSLRKPRGHTRRTPQEAAWDAATDIADRCERDLEAANRPPVEPSATPTCDVCDKCGSDTKRVRTQGKPLLCLDCAPPATERAQTCREWCGTQSWTVQIAPIYFIGNNTNAGFCTPACRDAGRPLHPREVKP